MVQYIFMALLLVLASLMLWYSGMRRLMVFIIAITFVPYLVSIPAPFLPSYRLFCLAVILSAMLRTGSFVEQMRRLPCLWALLLVLGAHLMTAVMDHRVAAAGAVWKACMAFVDTFLMLVVGYLSLYSNRQLRLLNIMLIAVGIVISTYGLLSGVIGNDFFGQFIGRVYGAESDFTPLRSLSRTRLTSFLFDPHLYGFYSSTLFTSILILNKDRLLQRPLAVVTLLLLLCGVVFSGSRSSLIALAVAVTIYVLLQRNVQLIMRYCFLLVVALGLALAIPATREKLSSVAEVFTSADGGKTDGSNRNMRERQLEISLYLYRQNPVWGNGFSYFNEVLKPDESLIQKQGLLGAESYLFVLLIEAGLVQMVCIGLLLLCLLSYFLLSLRRHPAYALWGLTILIQFLIVAFITGAFGRWQYALPFVGLAMRAIINNKPHDGKREILINRSGI